MADSLDPISKALTAIIFSLDNIPNKFTVINTLNNNNASHQKLIGEIQQKLTNLMKDNTSNDNNNSPNTVGNKVAPQKEYELKTFNSSLNGKNNTQSPTISNEQKDVNNINTSNDNNNSQNQVAPLEGYKQNFSNIDDPLNSEFEGGRRKRNRSSKNKRKSSEEQPEIKMEQEEAPESPKPQKKSFFSRFNPFKTKGGKRSRKHRTTKKGGRRHN